MDSLRRLQNNDADDGLSRRLVRRYFLFLFIPALTLIIGAVVVVFSIHIHHTRLEISAREFTKVELAQLSVRETLNTAITDLKFLVQDENMVNFAVEGTENHRQRLERTFFNFSGTKTFFDQIRFIDADGDEQVRINLVDRAPVTIPFRELQNKKHRYYFSDAVSLAPTDVFMSRLDLNMEQKKVEMPYKPMIRLAAPVDVNGERYGVVVLNYLAENFLGHIRRTFKGDESQGFLLNADGAWLIGPNRELEWSFMFGRDDRFQDLYPDAWRNVGAGVRQVETSRGIFTLTTITPPPGVVGTSNSDTYWVLVSYLPLSVWYYDQFIEHIPEALATFLVILALGLGSWRIAISRALREQMDSLYHRRLVDALNESERRNTAVVEASDDVVMTCTEKGYIRHANQAAETVFNVPQVDLVGRELTEFLMDPDAISMRQPDGERLLLECERFETYAVRATGEGFPAEINVTSIQTEGYTRFSVFVRDITLRRSYEERLKRLANYDPLTGLSNRVMLLDHLTNVLDGNLGPEGPYALIMGDLDDFRIVNDTLGHVVGDEALKEAADRIHQKAPSGSLACRFGGDEFVLVVPCRGDRDVPAMVCDSILNAFEQPLEVAGHRLYVGISLGVAFAESGQDTATGLLQMADVAMYAAKDSGRNTYRTFTKDMHEDSARRLAIQTRLAGAQARGDISLDYQPLIDAKTSRIIGAEALLRWTDAELGEIGPTEFVPVAESTGLIIDFGEWALNEACRHAREWREHIPNFHVAVNISPVQLIGSDVVSSVKTALLKYGLDPDALEVEITEGLLIKDPHEALITLNELANIGVKISIDDFGTGYSSLSYLHRFPFTTLKIDRIFVMDLPESEDSRSLVTTVLALAQRSNLKVIAEGVETQGQSEWLTAQGCNILQGYLFSRPLSVEAFDALVTNRDTSAEARDGSAGGGPNLKLV